METVSRFGGPIWAPSIEEQADAAARAAATIAIFPLYWAFIAVILVFLLLIFACCMWHFLFGLSRRKKRGYVLVGNEAQTDAEWTWSDSVTRVNGTNDWRVGMAIYVCLL